MYIIDEKSTVVNLTLFSIVGIVVIVAVARLLQTIGTTTYAGPEDSAQAVQAPSQSGGGTNTVGQASGFREEENRGLCGSLNTACGATRDWETCGLVQEHVLISK